MSSNNSKGRRNRGPRRSSPRKPEPEPKKNAPRRIPNKLYIGDLSESAKKEDLEREFARFGKLREVWLAHHPPGFAFVEFISAKDAADVIEAFDGKMLCGSKVRVEFAKANGPGNMKRQKRRDPPKAAVSATSLLSADRISPLLSLQVGARSLVSSAVSNRQIPPLLSLCHTSPPRRGRDDMRFKEVESLGIWGDRATSPVPLLLPAPKFHGRRSSVGRDRSPPTSIRELMAPPPLLSPSITRDLHRVYPLLPPPPPPLPPLASRRMHDVDYVDSSRGDGRGRSPARERSRSPVYLRRNSPPPLLPTRGRLLGRTPPPPLPRDRSTSLDRRFSPRQSRGRESPLRLGRSPPIRRGSPMSRSPLMEGRRTSPAKYKSQSNSNRRGGRSPYSRYSSPERAAPSNYLPRPPYSPSPRKQRSPSSPRQFRSTSRPRKGYSRSPRNSRSPLNWSRAPRRSRSPSANRNASPGSPSPKRFKVDRRQALPLSRSPSANGRRSVSRRSYSSPGKRYSPQRQNSLPRSPALRNHGGRRSKRRSTSMDYRPASPSPKRYSAVHNRSPPVVQSPSPYRNLGSRRSPPRGRSTLPVGRPSSPPNRGRTPPRMYRQDSPGYRSSPVPTRSQLQRSSPPFRTSERSPSSRRSARRSPKASPPPLRVNPRSFARSPSSHSNHSYRKASPPVARRCTPISQRSSPPSKRLSPLRSRRLSPQKSPSYTRQSPPSPPLPRPNRGSRLSVSPHPARMMSRRSRSASRSPLPMSRRSPPRGPDYGRRFSAERSVSPRRRTSPLRSRRSPSNGRLRNSPPLAKNSQSLYHRSSSPSPRRSSPFFRKGGLDAGRKRSPSPASQSPPARRGTRRSRSSSPAANNRRDWSPVRPSQHASPPAKSHLSASSWDQGKRYRSPKRKSSPSPPPRPPSPPQRLHRHKAKKMKA